MAGVTTTAEETLAAVVEGDGTDLCGVVLIEQDTLGDASVVWSYPDPGQDVEDCALDGLQFDEAGVKSFLLRAGDKWLYCASTLEGFPNDANSSISGACIVLATKALHSARYGHLARIFLAAFAACGEPTKLLELFLSAFSRGALKEAALPAGVSPAHLPPAGGAWRADAFDPRSFLHGSHPHELTQPFGPRLIAIWSAAISGRPILVSGGASARASLLVPLLAGFPTLSKHAYSRVFPALSSSAATAVSKGATPTTVAGADPAALTRGQRELLAPSVVKTGLVLGCGGGSDAAAWSSRREWWKCAAHLDTGVVVPAEGEAAWGLGSAAVGGGAGATAEGGSGDTFPSPLHAAVWRAVSEGLTGLPPDDGPATLWAFAKIWQGVNSTYILKPLAKVAEGGGGVLSRGALSNPDLGLPPSSANFLWEAAVALAAEGTAPFAVDGVSTA